MYLDKQTALFSTLIDDNKLCEWKMKALKEENGTAERIQKLIDAKIKEQN